MKFPTLLIAAGLLCISVHTTAQPGPRKKVGVVLSGGGAKGMAHIGALKAVFRTYCMDYPDYDFYCTYQASRKLKGLRNHQLHTVAGFFGFELENHHHALADAEACAWIARQIL